MPTWAQASLVAVCGFYLAALFSSDMAMDLLGTSYEALPGFVRRQMWRTAERRGQSNGMVGSLSRVVDLCLVGLCVSIFVVVLVYPGSEVGEQFVSVAYLLAQVGWFWYLARLPRSRVR